MNANAYILFYICKESPYKNDYFRFMKSIMNNIIIDKNKKEAIVKKDLNFFRGEPVITDYGEGYVVKDNIVDFNFNENYDIYDELKKIEDLRVEKLNKNHKKEKQSEKEDNKDISNKKENEEKNTSNEQENNNEINENKIIEIKINKEENSEQRESTNNNKINEEKVQIDNIKTKNIINKDVNVSDFDYFSDFLEIKFYFGNGSIPKTKVKKYNYLGCENKNENKTKEKDKKK